MNRFHIYRAAVRWPKSKYTFPGNMNRMHIGKYIIYLLAAMCFTTSASAQTLPVTSNLRIWLDAADVNAGGAQPANGATVSTWRDKSGNGYNVVTAGSASPTFESTGLNNLPSIRMVSGAKFSGGNIFTGSTSPQTTIFMVHNNVTIVNNFLFNLNGDTTDGAGSTARFSMHMPWGDGNYFFDAGGCCGSTRLFTNYPVPLYDAAVIVAGNSTTAYSGFTNTNQFVRFNGTTSTSDNTAIAPPITGGIRLGSTSGYTFNGRFSEIIVYDRALSLTEIRQVECYLGSKWAIPGMAGCTPVQLTASKTSANYVGNALGDFRLPGSDVIYGVTVSRQSGNFMDSGSIFLVDPLPSQVTFYNGDYDGSFGSATDPVGFTNNGTALTWNYATAVRYSNAVTAPANFAACTYTPIAGYDPNVRYICINPSGTMTTGNFTLNFRVQIK